MTAGGPGAQRLLGPCVARQHPTPGSRKSRSSAPSRPRAGPVHTRVTRELAQRAELGPTPQALGQICLPTRFRTEGLRSAGVQDLLDLGGGRARACARSRSLPERA